MRLESKEKKIEEEEEEKKSSTCHIKEPWLQDPTDFLRSGPDGYYMVVPIAGDQLLHTILLLVRLYIIQSAH